jgi:hypothetical protein
MNRVNFASDSGRQMCDLGALLQNLPIDAVLVKTCGERSECWRVETVVTIRPFTSRSGDVLDVRVGRASNSLLFVAAVASVRASEAEWRNLDGAA